jgi:hypothetical protein
MDLDMIAAVIKATLSPAIQAAMAPYATKISALENRVSPNPANNTDTWHNTRPPPAPRGMEASIWAPMEPAQHLITGNDSFTPVTHNRKGRKAKNKAGTAAPAPPPTQGETPITASYTSTAATTTNLTQPPAPPRQAPCTPTITEVTVIRSGGLLDKGLEESIWACPADAIIWEVNLKMAKAMVLPIPLKSGCRSIHPRSKGNFVYSFNGNIPFDLVTVRRDRGLK